MTDRVETGGLRVDRKLYDFINDEALPGTDVSADAFWSGFDRLVHGLSPRNRELLAKRNELQRRIDAWYQETRDQPIDLANYKAVLQEIGYLVPEGGDVTVSTANVDPEISAVAGPQLVVPVTNARYALNAANARWGSLYDALYGTDAISEADGAERTGDYNPVRGARVIARAREFLDTAAPLVGRQPRGCDVLRGRQRRPLGHPRRRRRQRHHARRPVEARRVSGRGRRAVVRLTGEPWAPHRHHHRSQSRSGPERRGGSEGHRP